MSSNVPPSPRYTRNPEVLAANLGAEEVALLSMAKGRYYGLNSPAAEIWRLLAAPQSLSDLCESLVRGFEVDQEVCERDTRELLADMMSEGLVIVAPQTAGD